MNKVVKTLGIVGGSILFGMILNEILRSKEEYHMDPYKDAFGNQRAFGGYKNLHFNPCGFGSEDYEDDSLFEEDLDNEESQTAFEKAEKDSTSASEYIRTMLDGGKSKAQKE